MIRAALELIAVSLFIAVVLMWSALLAHAQYFQPMPPPPSMQWMPPPPPMPQMVQPPPPQPLQQTTTCYRVGIQVVCTTR
jgi:hypothetical protein